jgi:hypothetical protein
MRGAFDEREQGEDPPLAVVVGAHDEGQVLHRHDERDRPDHEREGAEHVRVGAGTPCSAWKYSRIA